MSQLWNDLLRMVEQEAPALVQKNPEETLRILNALSRLPVFDFTSSSEGLTEYRTNLIDNSGGRLQLKDVQMPFDELGIVRPKLVVAVVATMRDEGDIQLPGFCFALEVVMAYQAIFMLDEAMGPQTFAAHCSCSFLKSGFMKTSLIRTNLNGMWGKDSVYRPYQVLLKDSHSMEETFMEVEGEASHHMTDALIALQYACQPAHYLLEARTKAYQEPDQLHVDDGRWYDENNKRINKLLLPRFDRRGKIIHIHPDEVRSLQPESEEGPAGGSSKTAHRRRGHYRTFRDERYGEKRGTTVWVRPAWIGPREWERGNTTYRVMSG